MKKYLLIALVLIGFTSNAQQHEVKLDVLDLIAFKSLDATYQYILNEESSVGLSIFKPLSDNNYIYNENFSITPFYRQYFPLGAIENIFAEAFFSINSGDGEDENGVPATYTDGAFGFAVGKKYISPRGFVLEGMIGLGRNLFDNNDSPTAVLRTGINIGYQF